MQYTSFLKAPKNDSATTLSRQLSVRPTDSLTSWAHVFSQAPLSEMIMPFFQVSARNFFEFRRELLRKGPPHDAVAPAAGAHAKQPQLQGRVRGVGRRVAPLARVLGDDLAASPERALLVAPPGEPRHARERRRGQRRERRAVAPKSSDSGTPLR